MNIFDGIETENTESISDRLCKVKNNEVGKQNWLSFTWSIRIHNYFGQVLKWRKRKQRYWFNVFKILKRIKFHSYKRYTCSFVQIKQPCYLFTTQMPKFNLGPNVTFISIYKRNLNSYCLIGPINIFDETERWNGEMSSNTFLITFCNVEIMRCEKYLNL